MNRWSQVTKWPV